MVNDAIFSYSLDLALSELEIIKSGNPKGKKSLEKGQQDIWSKEHVSEIKFGS